MKDTILIGLLMVLVITIGLSDVGAASRKHEFPVQHAKESESGKNMLDIPFFMKGEAHPAAAQTLGEYKSNKKANGFRKKDQVACDHAFASAIISLQQRAQKEGGNAVIDVYSITKDVKFESADKYSCVAGNTIVHVALMGTVAKIN